jgi:hypothetical protein
MAARLVQLRPWLLRSTRRDEAKAEVAAFLSGGDFVDRGQPAGDPPVGALA